MKEKICRFISDITIRSFNSLATNQKNPERLELHNLNSNLQAKNSMED